MGNLNSIADQLTPGRPIETTFGADTGTPSANQEILLIGHMGATGTSASGTAAPYTPTVVNNAGDEAAGKAEAEAKFGIGSELALMVLAAIQANAGGSTFPAIKCVGLASTDTAYGAADVALTRAQKTKAEFVVSCYDGAGTASLRTKLIDHARLVSGATRVDMNQYGTFAVMANRSTVDPADLPKPDTQFFIGAYLRDTGTGDDAPTRLIGEVAAMAAARMAGNAVPFNPLDDVTVEKLDAPKKESDAISVGASLESETVLKQGWTPLYAKPNGEVAFVRTVTSRRTVDADGETDVISYFDVQDFQVLYFWRKTLKTRFSQTDYKQAKASNTKAEDALAEMVRLAHLFQENNMFQAVDELAKQFRVARSTSDRSRLDYKTPVNVIPGLHVMAGNIEASTQFDTLSL